MEKEETEEEDQLELEAQEAQTKADEEMRKVGEGSDQDDWQIVIHKKKRWWNKYAKHDEPHHYNPHLPQCCFCHGNNKRVIDLSPQTNPENHDHMQILNCSGGEDHDNLNSKIC